ncbi:phage portal protein, partial [Lentzea aerocolonigenes]
LWPVRPDRMEPVTSPKNFLLGFIYTGPSGEQVPLDRKDVLFQRMPNPTDPYRGMGAVQSIMNTLDSVRYGAEWNNAFFRNNALPGGLVKVNKKMQQREWDKWRERWNESHQGVSNAGRVGMIEGEMEWIDLKISQRDMQFVEIAQLDKTTIREAFGMPKFAVGDVDDVNRATADAAKAWYAEAITVTRLDRWKGLLNNQYLPQFPDRGLGKLSLVYTNPVPADREAERDDLKAAAEVYKTLVDAGVHPDDAAIQAGLPPMRTTAPQQQDNNFGAELKGALA